MKLYKLRSGTLLDYGGNYFHLGNRNWDALINRNRLAEYLRQEAEGYEPIPVPKAEAMLNGELQPPVGSQEIWAAGVTYYRSRSARMEESRVAGGESFYDRVYEAERPELFFKSTAQRTVGHRGEVRIRCDSSWDVPEPELTLFINSSGSIEAYTIGNDMSSRSIEGENPLYLPQAKIYEGCAAIGPCLLVREEPLPLDTAIRLEIWRDNRQLVAEAVTISQMKRRPEELAAFLYRECSFPYGCFLMTGTGIVPDNFTLCSGDEIKITIPPIGKLVNTVGPQKKMNMLEESRLAGASFIGNRQSEKQGGPFSAISPADQQPLAGIFYEARPDDVDEAGKLAERAFGEYRLLSGREKAGFLETIASEIEALGDELVQRCMQETALPEVRLQGERARTCNQLRLFAELLREGSWVNARIDTALPDRPPVPRPDIRQMQQPLGPVAVFGASNFPLAFSTAGGDTASALAAGCPVVVKAHPAHPGTSELAGRAILRAARKCQMPEGVFSLLQGKSHEVGRRLVEHPSIKAVGFTGSFKGGKALFDLANRRPEPIPVFAEMGSVNPVFFLPGALKERKNELAEQFSASVSLGVGQFCTCPGLAIGIASGEMEGFIEACQAAFFAIPRGLMLTQAIQQSYEQAIGGLSSLEGVALAASSQARGAGVAASLFLATAQALVSFPQLQEEAFGPSTVLVAAEDKNDLLQVARKLKGHLTATVHATDQDMADFPELFRILEQKAGRVVLNGFPTGVEVCHAMTHGGPFPATTHSQSTSVGTLAIQRFTRPFTYQGFSQELLPEALRDNNPLHIWRMVNGQWIKQ
ncbi:MAG: aldehyde dehydrogenase family protein [Lewinellaceae bacterium]|nr:aldehyde dehydrogenase family protein [Lewinellaceae bacterium]